MGVAGMGCSSERERERLEENGGKQKDGWSQDA